MNPSCFSQEYSGTGTVSELLPPKPDTYVSRRWFSSVLLAGNPLCDGIWCGDARELVHGWVVRPAFSWDFVFIFVDATMNRPLCIAVLIALQTLGEWAQTISSMNLVIEHSFVCIVLYRRE